MEEIESNRKEENEKVTEIRGVLFVPHTNMSELSKRIRKKLNDMENISCLRIKVVERAGEKLVDALHKSNPWEETNCHRDDCLFCNGNNENMIGKCKQRGVVYETLCMLCERERKRKEGEWRIEEKELENNEHKMEPTGEKKKKKRRNRKDREKER